MYIYDMNYLEYLFHKTINYYDNHILIGKKKGIVLPSNENKIYIFNEDKQDWILAKPTEFSLFTNEIIKKFPIKREKLPTSQGHQYRRSNLIIEIVIL